jgi:hypothetical protein
MHACMHVCCAHAYPRCQPGKDGSLIAGVVIAGVVVVVGVAATIVALVVSKKQSIHLAVQGAAATGGDAKPTPVVVVAAAAAAAASEGDAAREVSAHTMHRASTGGGGCRRGHFGVTVQAPWAVAGRWPATDAFVYFYVLSSVLTFRTRVLRTRTRVLHNVLEYSSTKEPHSSRVLHASGGWNECMHGGYMARCSCWCLAGCTAWWWWLGDARCGPPGVGVATPTGVAAAGAGDDGGRWSGRNTANRLRYSPCGFGVDYNPCGGTPSALAQGWPPPMQFARVSAAAAETSLEKTYPRGWAIRACDAMTVLRSAGRLVLADATRIGTAGRPSLLKMRRAAIFSRRRRPDWRGARCSSAVSQVALGEGRPTL